MSRDGDNKWIVQYDALFCVLNYKGQILTWKLTQGMSFDDVEELLQSLKKRFEYQNKVVNAFYIDNCCAWRRKLKNVFGEDLKVYLDLFHAVKRFSDKVPKRHPLSYSCISEWKMVFRANSDHGKERCCTTPTPEVLELNLDNFIKRYTIQYLSYLPC